MKGLCQASIFIVTRGILIGFDLYVSIYKGNWDY